MALLAVAQPAFAIREMAGRYLKFHRYVVDWGTLNPAEKSTFVDFDPVGGYARVRPRLDSVPEGGEMELFWYADRWPKLVTENESFVVEVVGRISSRPSLGVAIGANASADKHFFRCDTPSGRAYWHLLQFAGRYSNGELVEGSSRFQLTLEDLSKIDPNVEETAIGIWFEPYGPTITYYYDVVRNVGDAPPTVDLPPPTLGGGGGALPGPPPGTGSPPPGAGGAPPEDTRQRCDRYARAADLHHQENLRLRCGYAGGRWQVNYDEHFAWCTRNDRALADAEHRVREEELDQCRRRLAPVGGFNYIGCFRDQGDDYGTAGRDLDGHYTRGDAMTTQQCVALCRERDFAFAGTQIGTQCFCGNSYGRSGPADNCDVPCAGDRAQICGGGWANSVYGTGPGLR